MEINRNHITFSIVEGMKFKVVLHISNHFPGRPRLAGIKMSPLWILLELRMMEVEVTTEAIRRAKLRPNCHHQHPAFNKLDAFPVVQPTALKH